MYFDSKELAKPVADELAADPRVAYTKVELEPYNGWIVICVPHVVDILDLADKAEIRHPSGKRLSKAPEGHKKQPSLPSASPRASGGSGGGAPRSGATGRVHAIADELKKEGKVSSRADRAKVIEACVEAGINPATASTQWAKWARNNGF